MNFDFSSAIASILAFIIFIFAIAISIGAVWRIFVKAGQPGWVAFIPIYSAVVMLQLVKKPMWWIIFFFVPIANIIMWFVVNCELAKVFGRGAGFAVGLIILPFIFYPILAFGSSKYINSYED